MKSDFVLQSKTPTAKPELSFTRPSARILQRKCACGGTVVAGGECAECRKKRLQTKLAVNQPGDRLEQEANRMADSVIRGRKQAPVLSNCSLGALQRDQPNTSSASTNTPPIVLEGSGQPLDSSTRAFMEPGFGHDFGNVRVHVDARAAASARSVKAVAYTVGHDIVFSGGAFAPDDPSGRSLLAHELAHVVQQSNAHTAQGQLQRQPDETSTKESPPTKTPPAKTAPAKAPPRKTLKSEGVDLNDPVAGGTAAIIDTVLARNQKLALYIGARIKGLKIAEKGKFVHETNDTNFDNAYRDAYDLNAGVTVPKSTMGFLNTKKSEIHLRSNAVFGTALHEAVHRLASPRLYGDFLPLANKISSTLTDVLSEGVTAFFTDEILKEEGLPNFNDAYRTKKDKAKNLIDALKPDGFDMIATFNFKGAGIVEIGEKLGFTRKQYGEAKNDAVKEVLKRMEKVL
jgi:Domain of unknown function (DUF4157)